jgi:hypothetical protein
MIAKNASDKADRKEQTMEEKRKGEIGRFQAVPQLHPGRRRSNLRWMTITVLLTWDGLLLYMIIRCLVEPVYGAVFLAMVSVCLGYQL